MSARSTIVASSLPPPWLILAVASTGARPARTSLDFSVGLHRHPGRRPPRPDGALHARRTRASPRSPRTSTSTCREGVFGNPGAIFSCRSADFALDAMPARLSGRADHDRRQLRRRPEQRARHRPDLQHGGPSSDEDRAVRLRRPDPQHPDLDPDRRAQRVRLRPADFDVAGDLPAVPLAVADVRPSGASRRTRAHDAERFPRAARLAAGLPRRRLTALHRSAVPAGRSDRCDRSSTTRASAPGQPLPGLARRHDLPGPGQPAMPSPATRRRPAAKTRSSTRSATPA